MLILFNNLNYGSKALRKIIKSPRHNKMFRHIQSKTTNKAIVS